MKFPWEFVAAQCDGAIVVDVLESDEYVGGHVPRARLVGQVSSPARELPKNLPVYLICGSGNRILALTGYLVRAGYDAYSVTGGTGVWDRAGHPMVIGDLGWKPCPSGQGGNLA